MTCSLSRLEPAGNLRSTVAFSAVKRLFVPPRVYALR